MEGFLSESVRGELVILLVSVFLGMVYGFIYDTLRIIRRVFPHRRVLWIAVEDIIFWIFITLHAYVTFYYDTNGGLRGYIIAGLCCGAGIYRVSIGKIYLKYVTRFLKFLIKPLKKFAAVVKIRIGREG